MLKLINHNLQNFLINGAMEVWNENSSIARPAGGVNYVYHAEMWTSTALQTTGQFTASTGVASGSRDSLCSYLASKSLRMYVDSNMTFTGSNKLVLFSTSIEGYIVRQFIGDWLSVGFWVKSNKPGIYSVSIADQYASFIVSNYTINTADTYEYKVLRFNTNGMTLVSFSYTPSLTLWFWGQMSTDRKIGTKDTVLPYSPYSCMAHTDHNTSFGAAGDYLEFTKVCMYRGKIENPVFVPFNGNMIEDIKATERYWQKIMGGHFYTGSAERSMWLEVRGLMRVPYPIYTRLGNFLTAGEASTTIAYSNDYGVELVNTGNAVGGQYTVNARM